MPQYLTFSVGDGQCVYSDSIYVKIDESAAVESQVDKILNEVSEEMKRYQIGEALHCVGCRCCDPECGWCRLPTETA